VAQDGGRRRVLMAHMHGVLGTDVQVAAKLSPMFSVMGTKVSCGYNFMYVISEDGQCFSWGCGKHGVLGHGDTSD